MKSPDILTGLQYEAQSKFTHGDGSRSESEGEGARTAYNSNKPAFACCGVALACTGKDRQRQDKHQEQQQELPAKKTQGRRPAAGIRARDTGDSEQREGVQRRSGSQSARQLTARL